jgi:hypothetical protein
VTKTRQNLKLQFRPTWIGAARDLQHFSLISASGRTENSPDCGLVGAQRLKALFAIAEDLPGRLVE